MADKLLIVVDYQNDFVDGALGFEGAEKLQDGIVNLLNNFDGTVLFTFDTHKSNYLTTREGRNLPVEHCIRYTKGWELYGKVNDWFKNNLCISITKDTFGSTHLGDILRNSAFKEIHFVGLVSNICVLSNCIIAQTFSPESEIIVNKDLIASFNKDIHEKTLDIMRDLHIKVSRNYGVLNEIK